ncbi:uncharacterized protein LOC124268079 [Haliotis rubra]|uniref:uncharacterized protein LOC124268079 n=1 Tax=Haliotis rubra TaxID=36100 RepID=UPI001EE5B4CD|nr:uncharacterized protein LOC124268079 [Haliotis rubra]
MDESINAIAVGVKHKSTLAKEMYDSGDLKGALEQFKLALRDSNRLIIRKRESVALCRLNLASAQIGRGDEAEKTDGRKALEQLLEENTEDNMLSACINFNLALASPDNDKKDTYLETCLEILERVKDAKAETLILQQKALEERLRLINVREKEERCQGNEPGDKQERKHDEKKLKCRKQLADVCKRLSVEAYTEMEESETVLCSKRVANLLAMANMTVAQNRQNARMYAHECLSILEEDWSRVQVNTCSDLAVLFTEIGAYEKAKLCFRKTQLCQNINELEEQEVQCHMFQNLGAVCVLERKYQEATQYFKDALGVIAGRASERRAHLYLNLGFAWSQMGRAKIWKTYEAYLNAAKYSQELNTETNLRLEALQGLVLAGMAVLDYRQGLGDFCVNVVLSHKEIDADATLNWQNINVSGFKDKMKEEIKDKYMTCIDNVNVAVLNRQL